MNISNKNFDIIKTFASFDIFEIKNFDIFKIFKLTKVLGKSKFYFEIFEIFIRNIHKYAIFRNFRKKIFFFDFFIILFPNKQNIFQTIFSFFSKFIIGVAVPGYLYVQSMESQIWVSRISRQFVTAARNLTLLRWRRATIFCRPSARSTDTLEPPGGAAGCTLYSVQS